MYLFKFLINFLKFLYVSVSSMEVCPLSKLGVRPDLLYLERTAWGHPLQHFITCENLPDLLHARNFLIFKPILTRLSRSTAGKQKWVCCPRIFSSGIQDAHLKLRALIQSILTSYSGWWSLLLSTRDLESGTIIEIERWSEVLRGETSCVRQLCVNCEAWIS